MTIYTRADGTPIPRPERSDYASDEDFARAYYAWKDELRAESERGILEGMKEFRRHERLGERLTRKRRQQ